MKTCPFCAEDIQDAAIYCKHCHRDVPPTAPPTPIEAPPIAAPPTPSEAPPIEAPPVLAPETNLGLHIDPAQRADAGPSRTVLGIIGGLAFLAVVIAIAVSLQNVPPLESGTTGAVHTAEGPTAPASEPIPASAFFKLTPTSPPPSTSRAPVKQSAAVTAAQEAQREAQRETQRAQAADEFETDPETLRNKLVGVTAMLERDDLRGADAALNSAQVQVQLLLEGRLKDTPGVGDMRQLLENQKYAREGAKPRERELAQRRAHQGVTARNYALLRTGMTYEEVVDILGRGGTELSSVDMPGIFTVMYEWQGDGGLGANMNATFQNGRLFTKAQYGLR